MAKSVTTSNKTPFDKTSAPKKQGAIIKALEKIVENAENSKLSDDFFKENNEPISYASEKLKLTPMQVVFLALFIDKSDESNLTLSKIAEYVGCRPMHLLSMAQELENLEKLRYIRIISNRKASVYRVPKEVINSLMHDEPYVYKRLHASDLITFFDGFKRLVREKEDDELDYETLKKQAFELLQCIPNSSLLRGLKKYKIGEDSRMLFLYMAYLLVEDCNEDIRFYEMENLYDNDEIPYEIKSELRYRTSSLFKHKLIENTFEEGMARSDSFKITEKAKFELLSDLGDLNLKGFGQSENGLLKHDSFPQKKLFYNNQTVDKINELKRILSAKSFIKVQDRLKKSGMRPGFCCLFYGSPGTGKTETVYQLARETKRNIMQVDVDKIKSCWVGESEKNIKALFDRYRVMCNNSENLPILLFNEADAILGVRMEGVSRAADKMENSIQNIILQEMEKLEGIMIATTNLTTNLDKAFERRFLYKIKYERPSEEARAKIWQSMIPSLKKKDALALAKDFDLSGGEIENIARKLTVNYILKGASSIDLDYIRKLSHEERLKTINTAKIGF